MSDVITCDVCTDRGELDGPDVQRVGAGALCAIHRGDLDEDAMEAATEEPPTGNGLRPVAGESDEERQHRATALEREEARLVTFDAMATRPPPEWLVDDLLVAGSSAVLYSPPSVGKSFVALDIAACVATGTWWHGRAVRQGPVLYVAAEGTGGLPVRVQAWKAHNRMAWVDAFDFLPGSINLLDPGQAATLAELTVAKGYRLVVVDTMARVTAGGDENSPKDMGLLVAAVAKLQAAGATVLMVHHPGKDAGKGMRGHSSLRGALDTEIEAKEVGERLVTLVCQKQKDAQEFLPVRLGLKVVTFADEEGRPFSSSCAVDKAARTSADDDPRREEARGVFVRSFVRSGCTAPQLRDALQETLEVGRTKAYELINTLVSEGFLANTGSDKRPFYTLADPEDEQHYTERPEASGGVR
ncbi:MAG TPA: helicase RepA family protein [Acidimicrobiales bacterium]|nr:helicase RepA family protein [Acidimicrobiales bacterium]